MPMMQELMHDNRVLFLLRLIKYSDPNPYILLFMVFTLPFYYGFLR